MGKDLMCRRKRLKRNHHEEIFKKTRANVQFEDLPGDLLSTVLSKLPLKDAVRTGVLSSKWKDMWKVCPKLKFDRGIVSGANMFEGQQYTQKFINSVKAVMQQRQSKVVEELQIKFEVDSSLVGHIDSWVDFAVSSRVKNLALDLSPIKFLGQNQYRFPFKLLDGSYISRLQHIQLSYTSFELAPQFSGFPNLRALDLHYICVTRHVLQDMLSNCINLERLSLVRCHLNDELKVARPLSNLLYLCVAHCDITRIELNAIKLRTFIFYGVLHPIDLGHTPELKDTSLQLLCSITFEHAFTALANVLPSVQNLIFRAYVSLKTPLMENLCKFSRLKSLQLWLSIPNYGEDDNIVSLSSILRAAPLTEKLEIHFRTLWAITCWGLGSVKRLPRCPRNYMKNVHITGYMGSVGELELLLHIVENAAALEENEEQLRESVVKLLKGIAGEVYMSRHGWRVGVKRLENGS
uniref:F-box domain-containing protein n=1 Tax=Leersia perrieri TaxID=77586 RepID=A0A0D9WN05_9ORYZ